jgi:hypothetical protein
MSIKVITKSSLVGLNELHRLSQISLRNKGTFHEWSPSVREYGMVLTSFVHSHKASWTEIYLGQSQGQKNPNLPTAATAAPRIRQGEEFPAIIHASSQAQIAVTFKSVTSTQSGGMDLSTTRHFLHGPQKPWASTAMGFRMVWDVQEQ